MELPKGGYRRHMVIGFYVICALLLGALVFFLVTRLMLPFVIAWFTALLFQPLINRFVRCRKGRVRKAVSTLILSIVLSLLLYIAVALVNRGYSEVIRLAEYFAMNSEGIIDQLTAFGEGLKERFNLTDKGDYLGQMLLGMLENGVSSLSSRLTTGAASFLMKMPNIIFVTVIYILACFYMSGDFDGINRYFSSLLPEKSAVRFQRIKNKIFRTTLKYFRAYLILLLITFAELLIAFLILKIDYALLLAAIIAILDILPAIGVGTVLVPWAIILFIKGQVGMGVALIAVYLIITVIRQIAESHIIGSQLGISALATLFSVYVGFRLCGVFGMIIAPLAALLVKNAVEYYRTETLENKSSQ